MSVSFSAIEMAPVYSETTMMTASVDSLKPSGAVTRPELLIDFIVRREWQEAAGGIDALMSNDDGAVVRGIGFVGDEERHEELFCNLGIDFDALDHVLIEDGIFLDGDEGADSSLTEQ